VIGSRRWRGFSMVEIIVSISVIGLLMALILPAVQSSRSAARQVSCYNNLRQFAIAGQQYHDGFGMYPVVDPYLSLLPFLEQTPLFQVLSSGGSADRSPDVFLCSEDPNVFRSGNRVSYGLNEGNGRFEETTINGSFSKLFNGMRRSSKFRYEATSVRDFSDGTSNTAMYSERRVIPETLPPLASAVRDPSLFRWYMDRDYSLPEEFDEFRSACRTVSLHTFEPVFASTSDSFTTRTFGYDHTLPPNTPGCYISRPPMNPMFRFWEGSFPATSLHKGGVNLVFIDGHCRFISNSIDMEVWSALGTRNGSEPVVLD
jgi:prepilin-type N-terminal cleavage/methylation domain-containing protein/prepilin-type processing-associated H-X9-DG protein